MVAGKVVVERCTYKLFYHLLLPVKGLPPKKNIWPSWGTTKKTMMVLGNYFSVDFSRERITPSKKQIMVLGYLIQKKDGIGM